MQARLDVNVSLLEYDMQSRIVLSTDSSVPSSSFGHLDCELQLLVQIGFMPAE